MQPPEALAVILQSSLLAIAKGATHMAHMAALGLRNFVLAGHF